MPAAPTVTTELAAHAVARLALDAEASAPYAEFVYADAAAAARVQAVLAAAGAGALTPAFARGIVLDGELAGLAAWATGHALGAANLRAARALVRAQELADARVARRVALAGAALLRPAPEDVYLARFAVAPRFRGRGVGRALLAALVAEAAARHAPRIVLEVSPRHARAIAVYAAAGFTAIGEGRAADPETGRELVYLHLARERAA